MPKIIDPKSGKAKFYRGPGRRKDKDLGVYDKIIKKPMVIHGKMNSHLTNGYKPLTKLTPEQQILRDQAAPVQQAPKPPRPLTFTNPTNPRPKIVVKDKNHGKFQPGMQIYDDLRKEHGNVIRHEKIDDANINQVTVKYLSGIIDTVDAQQIRKHKRKARKTQPGIITAWRESDGNKEQ